MKTFHHVASLREYIATLKAAEKRIGLIPTMGALHEGHLSLVEQASTTCDVVVTSVFVNPTQFNESQDFDAYPRHLNDDAKKLENAGCDILFAPTNEEVYPEPDPTKYTFGHLDETMEGNHRPGHFNGVGMVVKRLFEIVEPDAGFFGQKDIQQVAVVRSLVQQYELPVEVVGCPTVREPSGLAMSSRNLRLSEEGLKIGANISKALKGARERASASVPEAKDWATQLLNDQPGLDLEYFETADAHDLQLLEEPEKGQSVVACVAAWVEGVRLIDNMVILD